jgi:hypothetical protein
MGGLPMGREQAPSDGRKSPSFLAPSGDRHIAHTVRARPEADTGNVR